MKEKVKERRSRRRRNQDIRGRKGRRGEEKDMEWSVKDMECVATLEKEDDEYKEGIKEENKKN